MLRLVQRLNRFYEWAGLKINTAKCAVCGWNFKSGSALDVSGILINGR